MPKRISLKQTKINDAFWLPYQKLVKDVVIPYQEQILNDEVPGAEKSHAMANFRIAAGEGADLGRGPCGACRVSLPCHGRSGISAKR